MTCLRSAQAWLSPPAFAALVSRPTGSAVLRDSIRTLGVGGDCRGRGVGAPPQARQLPDTIPWAGHPQVRNLMIR